MVINLSFKINKMKFMNNGLSLFKKSNVKKISE